MLNARLETKVLDRYLEKMKRNVRTLKPFFVTVVSVLHRSIMANFRVGGRPAKWTSLSAMTIESRRKRKTYPGRALGQPILQEYGTLAQSIGTVRVITNQYCEFGTSLTKAAPLQYGRGAVRVKAQIPKHWRRQTMAWGRRIKPKMVEVKAHTKMVTFGKVPARPFVMFQVKDVDRITAYASAYVFDPERVRQMNVG